MIIMGKFPIDVNGQTISIPDVYEPRYAGYDKEYILSLWAEVDVKSVKHKRHAVVIGTDDIVPEDMTYVDTFSPSCGMPCHLYIGSKIESVNPPPPPPPPLPPPGGGLI